MGEWTESIPDTMMVEHQGVQVPLRSVPFVKDAPDLPTFAKQAYDAHREVGARIPLRATTPEAIAAWRTEHLPKLYKAGILEAPPATPQEYAIARPEDLPEGLGWSDDLSGKLAGVLHRYGVPKAAVPELLALHRESLLGAESALKTSYDEGMVALKTEHGDKFAERQEAAKRLTSLIFKSPEEVEFFERTGMGNHPGFLSVLMRLAPLAAQDSSFVKDLTEGGGSAPAAGDEVRREVADIMSNPQNPKNKLYWQRDPATLAYVESLYKKAYGEAKVELH